MAESIVSGAAAGVGRRDEAADLPARPVGRRSPRPAAVSRLGARRLPARPSVRSSPALGDAGRTGSAGRAGPGAGPRAFRHQVPGAGRAAGQGCGAAGPRS